MSSKQILSKAVGIDLGTTNSAVAIMNPTDTEITIHRDQYKAATTPSCIWRDPKTKEVIVGSKAFARIGSMPSPIRSVKRYMGTQEKFRLTDEDILPDQFSAYVLKEMKRQIEEDTARLENETAGWVVDRAIVTVPAYFDQPQIDATRHASELAGLEVVDLLHEPTAAACYHCWKQGIQDGLFMVYDLGGGTFDVSVVRVTGGQFEVLGISGNNQLGGDDLDTAIADYLLEGLKKDYALDLDFKDPEDRLRFDLLKLQAETVKKALSGRTEFLLRDTSLKDKKGSPVLIEQGFERSEINKVIRPIVEKTIPYCQEALSMARGKADVLLANVDGIILAGGSTHVPLVRELVQDAFCAQPGAEGRAKCSEPAYDSVDTLVALGAAIRAAVVGGLAISDSDRNVRVAFRGAGHAGGNTTRAAGTVQPLREGVDLEGGTIRIVAGDHDEETDLKAGGAFAFKEIPLKPGAENLLTFEVFDKKGSPIASVGRPVAQNGDAAARPTGGAGSTAVVSKPIMLEVIREGKLTKHPLVEALQTLPYDQVIHAKHPGNTDTIILPVYQLARKIKEIEVKVDSSLPAGTPVDLHVHMDETYLMTVRGKIGDQEFEVSIETPPDRQGPTPKDIAMLKAKLQEGASYLTTGDRLIAEEKWEQGLTDLEKANDKQDRAGAVHAMEQLEEFVSKIEPPAALDPPKTQFDKIVDDCNTLNQQVTELARDVGRPHDPDETRKNIEIHRQQGETAFKNSDQRTYSEVIAGFERITQHLFSIGRSMIPEGAGPSDEDRAEYGVQAIPEEAESVANRARAMNKNDIADKAMAIANEVRQLARQVHSDPKAVIMVLRSKRAELERLSNSLGDGKSGRHLEI